LLSRSSKKMKKIRLPFTRVNGRRFFKSSQHSSLLITTYHHVCAELLCTIIFAGMKSILPRSNIVNKSILLLICGFRGDDIHVFTIYAMLCRIVEGSDLDLY